MVSKKGQDTEGTDKEVITGKIGKFYLEAERITMIRNDR